MSSSDFVYTARQLQIEDLVQLAELEQATQLDPWSEAQVLAIAPLLESGEYLGTVLSHDSEMVAYILARVFLDECEILSVGVAPSEQGKGLGKQVLQAFLLHLPEFVAQVHLEVRVSNLSAQRLYAGVGFIEVGRRKGYYAVLTADGQSGREDALLMSKFLKTTYMNLHKTYPEAHDAWLYAMGIDVRWRHRAVHEAVDSGAPLLVDVPESIAHARYWLIGTMPLNAAEVYVLAGMLWAINADMREVVYSTLADQTQSSVHNMTTALPAWPQLRTLEVGVDSLTAVGHVLDEHPHMHVVLLQDEKDAFPHHERLIHLPSLHTICADALQKQLTWGMLKTLRS